MSEDTKDGAQRVTVTLPADAIAFLRSESKRTGAPVADVLRRSIANEKFFREARAGGANVLLEEQGKPVSRLVFRD